MNKHFSIVTWHKYHKNKIREEWKLLNAICNVKIPCWDTETHMYLKLTCRHVDIWSRLFSVNDPLIFCGGFLPNIWVGILREEQLVMFSKIYTSNIPCLTFTPKICNNFNFRKFVQEFRFLETMTLITFSPKSFKSNSNSLICIQFLNIKVATNLLT